MNGRLALTGLDDEYMLYARHDRPADTLQSDSKYFEGQNPTLAAESPANK